MRNAVKLSLFVGFVFCIVIVLNVAFTPLSFSNNELPVRWQQAINKPQIASNSLSLSFTFPYPLLLNPNPGLDASFLLIDTLFLFVNKAFRKHNTLNVKSFLTLRRKFSITSPFSSRYGHFKEG